MNDYSGERFLDKLYSDLYMSDVVQHTKENKDKRYEAIRKYLDRLEKIHKEANTETKMKLLKSLYYDKYVISKDVLWEKYKAKATNRTDKERLKTAINNIILNQKESLDKWLDYLFSEEAHYPMWAKYWAFQGMLKMGVYDEGIDAYQKRSKDTETPFVDANPEIIAKAISTIEKSVNKENITDEELKALVTSGSFSKIYTLLEKRYKNNLIEYSGIEGEWVKYRRSSKTDAKKLCESLQGKNTHWCTAAEDMAIAQICGGYGYCGGDFYVYYTKDNEGNNTLPRVAIRMDGTSNVGEIRGILDGQNIEEELIPILEEKLKSLNVQTKDIMNKVNDIKELSKIYRKTCQNEELTKEEITNLYTKKYGFGYYYEPIYIKLFSERDVIKDFKKAGNAVSMYNHLARYLRDLFTISDSDFIIEYINKTNDLKIMAHVDPKKTDKYNEIAELVVSKDGSELENIDLDYVDDISKLSELAVDESASSISHVVPSLVTNYEELAEYAAECGYIYDVDPDYVSNYEELAILSIEAAPYSIKGVKKKFIKDYDKLAKLAISEDPSLIKYEIKPRDVKNFSELAKIAITQDGELLDYIEPQDVKNYEELAKISVTKCPLRTPNAQSIIIGSNTIDPKNIKDFEELTRISIGNFPTSLSSIAPEDVTNYQELADLAVSLDSKAIIGISPEAVNNYDSLAIKAVSDNANLFEYLDERYLSEETLKKLRRIHKDVDAKRKRIFKKEDIESSMYDEYGDELRIPYDDVYDDEMFGMNGLGFIDIFSITVLLFALGFMIMTILKLK